MGWSDPYDKFYKDDEGLRAADLAKKGVAPGSLVYVETDRPSDPLRAWSRPYYDCSRITVPGGIAIVLAVNTDDPVVDWISCCFGGIVAWLPSSCIKRLE